MERLVTLIGGSGFVGVALTEQLARRGYRMRVLSRHLSHLHRLKPLGNLGQIALMSGDITQPQTLGPAIHNADAVINLVGILDGTARDFHAMHVDGARNVAQAAMALGVRSLIQVSAIGADPASPAEYGRSKAAGETAVRAAFPAAAIVRPAILFGAEDNFTNRFARLLARSPLLPIIAPEAKIQPVHVGDLAAAIVAIVERQLAGEGAETWEIAGPEVMTMQALVEYIARTTGQDRLLIETPDGAARLLAGTPGSPITPDQLAMLMQGNVASGNAPGLPELGIVPAPLAAVASAWLARYRPGGRFATRAA